MYFKLNPNFEMYRKRRNRKADIVPIPKLKLPEIRAHTDKPKAPEACRESQGIIKEWGDLFCAV